ncbi:hypothetical protein AWZ03_011109 [Drosophila navojoa]|uniref:Larval cuticle protein A2B n=1 Tax=Drosophila navojoa TaxID=7232 RepID=A0A484B0T3_DRONA|nr:hypothetical protein AWZ03_011109 [Drosophila navojoa]
MAYKIAFALVMLGVAQAAVLRTAAPVAVASAPVLAKTVELEEIDPHPQYSYSYDVQDNLSGDSKGHVEERDGDVVRGEYSLIDADGFKRTVTYTADSINGFNAVVRREPIIAVAEPVVKATPVAVAAPLLQPGYKTERWPVCKSFHSFSAFASLFGYSPSSTRPLAMAFQYLAILALVAAASAGVLPAQQVYHAAPAQAVAYAHAPVAVAHAQPVLAKHDDEYDPHPQYKFAYDVQDSLSGDSKSQVEERDGDVGLFQL